MNEIQSWWQKSPALLAMVINNGLNIVVALLILIIGWVIAGWVSGAIRRSLSKTHHLDITLTPIVASIARWVILTFTIIAVLARFGVQTASLLAVLGAAGLAIGLALQGTLSNVASGIMLLTLRPIRTGEYVAGAGCSGTVLEIGIFTTTLLSYDGTWQSIPNSTLWSSSITNYSRGGLRMIELQVPVDYREDVRQVITLVEGLMTDPRLKQNPAPTIVVGDLTPTSIIILVRCWAERADFFPAKFDLQKNLKVAFDEAGYSFAVNVIVKPVGHQPSSVVAPS